MANDKKTLDVSVLVFSLIENKNIKKVVPGRKHYVEHDWQQSRTVRLLSPRLLHVCR